MSDEEILTVQQVAARLRVKSSWVYSHADDIGVYRAGKYLRFTWSRVLEGLDRSKSLDTETNDPEPHPLNQTDARR